MIRIESTRCIRCGLCARVCVAHCLHMTENAVTVRHEDYCLRCGQCVAVCPNGAVSLNGTAPDALPPMQEFPSMESMAALIRGRRSVRAFKDMDVPRDTLLQALDVVRHAPTGKNLENVSWLVLEGRPALRRVADAVVDLFRKEKSLARLAEAHDKGEDPIFRGAPCAVFACAEGTYDLDIVNCSIAASTLDLLLPTMGLGACWAGYVMRAAALDENVRKVMDMDGNLRPMAGLMVGFPALHYRRVPERRPLRVRFVHKEEA